MAVPFASPDLGSSANDALYCFSAHGKLRWRHVFADKFRFGGHDYGPPWQAYPLMAISDGNKPAIWSVAREALWSPSTLIEFDRDGNKLAQFVNWGHIAVLRHVHNASGSYILAGGISNQCDCAMLAVLTEDDASGSSPPQDPTFTCENCPPGRPYRYFLFPRSELSQLSGAAYNVMHLIREDSDHLWVAVSETYRGGKDIPGPDWIKYDLSDDFTPRSLTVSDHYWTLHRQMEGEGKIHHSIEQCPDRAGRKVKMWSAERGWEDIFVPVSSER